MSSITNIPIIMFCFFISNQVWAIEPSAICEKASASTLAEPEKNKSYIISGHILTRPYGEVVAGATVTLWHGGDGKTLTAQTANDGTYVFTEVKPSKYEYVLRTKNPPGIWVDWNIIDVLNGNIEDKHLYLTLPQSVSGVVRDIETGKPVTHSEIAISTANRNRDSISTDVEGRFRFYVNPRSVALTCEGTTDRYYPTGSYRKTLSVGPGQNLENIEFNVISAPKFTGQVLYPDGRPAENIQVDVKLWWSGGKNVPHSFAGAFGFGGTLHLKTDTEGKFFGYLRYPVGMKNLHPNINLTAFASVPNRSLGGTTHVETTTTASEIISMRIVLEEAAIAIVRIIDPNGNPIDNAKVTVSDNSLNQYPYAGVSVKYLGDGKYHIGDLIPGLEYYIAAQAVGYRYHPDKAKKFVLKPSENFDTGTLTLCQQEKVDDGQLWQLSGE